MPRVNQTDAITGTKSEDRRSDFPPKEEHSVLRNLGQVELQLRKAIPLVGKETRRVGPCRHKPVR